MPVGDGAAVAVGPEGQWFAMDRAGGAWRGGRDGGGASLPSPLPALPAQDATVAHGFFHGRPTVVAVSRDTGEAACVSWDGAAWAPPPRGCPAGDFAFIDAFGPAGRGRHWVATHGEGHPGLALLGRGGRRLPSPVDNLYPFGPVTPHAGRRGAVHLVTPCALGTDAPCAGPDGTGPGDAAPTAWWSWRPGARPRLRAAAVPADFAPAPSGGLGAWRSTTGEVCVGPPAGPAPRCFRIP